MLSLRNNRLSLEKCGSCNQRTEKGIVAKSDQDPEDESGSQIIGNGKSCVKCQASTSVAKREVEHRWYTCIRSFTSTRKCDGKMSLTGASGSVQLTQT